MKIVMVARLPKPVGGAEVFAEGLAARLSDRGVRVTVVTHRAIRARSLDGAGPRIFRYRAKDHTSLLDRGVRIHPVLYYERTARGVTVRGVDPGRSATDQLRVVLAQERPDLLHSHWHSLLPEVTEAAEAVGLPCIHTIHGMVSLTRATRRGLGTDQALRLIRRRVHAIAVSQDVLARCRRHGLSRVALVHPGVDDRFFRPAPGLARRDFLYVGRAERYKGAREACEGFLDAATRLEGRLWLAGRGMTRDGYATHGCFLPPGRRAALGRLIEERRVGFLGELPPHRLRARYQRSRALLLPSLTEGFPLAVLEALSCGTPVIASDVGSIADVVESGRNGILIPKGDARALTRALRALPSLEGSRLSARCRASARAFSLDRVAARHLEMYRRVMAAARPSDRVTDGAGRKR
jgi:glycosyltransferase involved in cell wall biosynthesis